ncbi:MAG: glucose-6-phosphate dehydrogenase [Phycisphaerae bacterium]
MTDPATIVIFGASGDLTSRKLIPALFDNFRKNRLSPQTRILGFSRTKMTDDEFRDKLYRFSRETLGRDCDAERWSRFSSMIHYLPGDLSRAADYERLNQTLERLEGDGESGRLYYLAIAPLLYPMAVKNLGDAGMAQESEGWRRVVIEKPFGRDLASAQDLNRQVHAVFDERQVYRIDHYLGKETVQNLLVFRFANSVFEPVWNRNYVDHVQITVAERVTVGNRGAYYDTAGVLRDIFQNHMMQVLALVAMEPPSRFEANALRDEKVKVLNAVRVPKAATIENCSIVGQYAGYHNEPGVPADSVTATYAALRLHIDNWRWKGVPFYLRSGKALAGKTTEIIVQFLRPPHLMFDVGEEGELESNRIVITVQPDEGIRLTFQTKLPDQGMTLRTSELEFLYSDVHAHETIPDAYERLLLDCLNGDASLFIRSDEIELAWRIIDPVIDGWERRGEGALPMYKPGTWGPVEADHFMAGEGQGWINDAAGQQARAP